MKKQYYLPDPQNPTDACVGEHYFLHKIRHWKLAVILGYSWQSTVVTQRGFSFFPRKGTREYIENFLTENGIEYKVASSMGGWSLLVNISKKKANLQKIDEMYEKFYKEQLEKIYNECVMHHENFYVNQEYLDYVKNDLGCEIDYYEPITK